MLLVVKNHHPKQNLAGSEICTFIFEAVAPICAQPSKFVKTALQQQHLLKQQLYVVNSCKTACMHICIILWLQCHITQLNTTKHKLHKMC